MSCDRRRKHLIRFSYKAKQQNVPITVSTPQLFGGGFLRVSKIDQTHSWLIRHYVFDMQRELTATQALAVSCPTCGASPGQKCELNTGQPRNEPHRDRRLQAKESKQ